MTAICEPGTSSSVRMGSVTSRRVLQCWQTSAFAGMVSSTEASIVCCQSLKPKVPNWCKIDRINKNTQLLTRNELYLPLHQLLLSSYGGQTNFTQSLYKNCLLIASDIHFGVSISFVFRIPWIGSHRTGTFGFRRRRYGRTTLQEKSIILNLLEAHKRGGSASI